MEAPDSHSRPGRGGGPLVSGDPAAVTIPDVLSVKRVVAMDLEAPDRQPRKWLAYPELLINGLPLVEAVPVDETEWMLDQAGWLPQELDLSESMLVGDGMHEDWLAHAARDLSLGRGGERFPLGLMPMAGCCGDPDCGWVAARVRAVGRRIVWQDWTEIRPDWDRSNHFDPPLSEPAETRVSFSFEKDAYLAAMREFVATPWGSPVEPGVPEVAVTAANSAATPGMASAGASRGTAGTSSSAADPRSRGVGSLDSLGARLTSWRERGRARRAERAEARARAERPGAWKWHFTDVAFLESALTRHDPLRLGPDAQYDGVLRDLPPKLFFSEIVADPEGILAEMFARAHGRVADAEALRRIGDEVRERGVRRPRIAP